jgi:phi13 family phage major tail protein
MKANVGMIYPVASPVSAYSPYTSITYGTGFVVSEARGASLTWEADSGEFYGDDIRLDSINDIIGYTLDFEAAGLADSVRVSLLGEVKSSDLYKVTGASAPDVGFGYIKKMRDNTSGSMVTSYEAWWFYKIKFGMPNEEARTKERTVEWRAPTMNGVGSGVFLTSGAEVPDFAEHETFSTLAAAKAYLNGKAGIS